MNYTIVFHEKVWSEDFEKLDIPVRKKIFKAIEKKLTTNPLDYGKALTGNLQGFFRLRVDDYRVVYSIREKEVAVYVLKVGFRRDMEVYFEVMKRI